MPFEFNKENLKRAKEIISRYPSQYKKGETESNVMVRALTKWNRCNDAFTGFGTAAIGIHINQRHELRRQIIGCSSYASL